MRRVRPVFIDRTEAWAAFAARELIGAELRPADLFYVCRKEAEQHYESVSLLNLEYISYLLNVLLECITQLFE